MGVRFEQFKVAQVFGNSLLGKYHNPKNLVIDDNGYPYICASNYNNGINKDMHRVNGDNLTLTPQKIIAWGKQCPMFCYHDEPCVTSQGMYYIDVSALNENAALYICGVLQKTCGNRYSYSNCLIGKLLDVEHISLPVIESSDIDHKYTVDDIDWDYMEKYIAELEQERIAELEQYLIATGLNDYTLTDEDKAVLSLYNAEWSNEITDSKDVGTVQFEEFEVNKLFKLQKISHKVDKLQLSDDYEYPAYSSDTRNNGILGYAKVPEFICDEVNRVYLIFGDHTRTMNIARESFAVLDNVKVLIPCIDSDEAILYMCTLWKKCIQDLGYSRHWKIAKDCKLRLPITQEKDPDCKYHKDGYIPDFAFMERYIKAMEKVVIADVVKYKDGVIVQTKALVNT